MSRNYQTSIAWRACLVAAGLLAACSGTPSPGGGADAAPDLTATAPDVGSDVAGDVGMDLPADGAMDLAEVRAPDLVPDVPSDLAAEVIFDVLVDAGVDAPADVPVDVAEDVAPDVPACPAGEPCDDGDACTTDDTCDAEGDCLGTPLVCDDGDPCTVGDACEAGACLPGVDLCECHNDADCAALEDGDFCNGTLICQTAAMPATCVVDPDTVVDCGKYPKPLCGELVCVSELQGCIKEPYADGTPCDDLEVCTLNDACVDGECVGAAPPACGIGAPCMEDVDCLPGQECLASLPGGYCTKPDCQAFGCPAGTVCEKILPEENPICLRDCDGDDECRGAEGYQCFFPGCWCEGGVCEPGAAICAGETACVCNDCGSGCGPEAVDCAAQGLVCEAGACVECNECACQCPPEQKQEQPYCGIDGVTYPTFCALKCALGGPECTGPGSCPAVAYPATCDDVCVTQPGGTGEVGAPVPAFQCVDLNFNSAAFHAVFSDITLKERLWIAYIGGCS